MKNPLTVFSRRPSIVSQSPWRVMAELENEMDRWFSRSSLPDLTEGYGFSPMSELEETDTEYLLRIEIPGIKKEDVKIEVSDNRLTVSGERREERDEKALKRHFSETFYGSFMRSFSVPNSISEAKVKAHYENGILSITIPKTERPHAKTIAIQ